MEKMIQSTCLPVKSCLVRVPGTLNSKNNQKVRIIQKWDGKSPAIQWITSDFKDYLIKKKIDKVSNKEINNKKKNIITRN